MDTSGLYKAFLQNMQIVITNLLDLLPRFIALLPYKASYIFIIILAKQHNLLCWSRNSYQHKRIVPGLSDIDFTILYSLQHSSSQLKNFLSLYAQFKKIIPILGEINIYQQETLYLTEKWANPYELNRDPLLKKYIIPRPKEPFARFCYLLRMLESDAKNLIYSPQKRTKKWSYHFSEAKLAPLNQLQLNLLISSITSLKTVHYSQEEINNFLSRFIKDGPKATYSYLRSNRAIKLFIVLLPHRWLVLANGMNDVEICLNANQFSSDEVNLILHQLYWDLAGLQAQVSSLAEKHNSLVYLDLILNFLNCLKTVNEEVEISLIINDVLLLKSEIKNQTD
jgi:hypothetical protein